MIDAEIKWIDWADDCTGSIDKPDFLLVTVGIGERGSEGADNFDVKVCNVAGLNNLLSGQAGLWPRGMLIVEKIDVEHVEIALRNLTKQFGGSRTWPIFAERINRYLHWEYEDFDDYQGEPIIPEFD